MNWFKKIAQQDIGILINNAQQKGVLEKVITDFAGRMGVNPAYISQLIRGGNLEASNDPRVTNNIGIFTNLLKTALSDARGTEGEKMQNEANQYQSTM